jgi:hypothetical protein
MYDFRFHFPSFRFCLLDAKTMEKVNGVAKNIVNSGYG